MSYTLYYCPGTASMALHWMLIELGVSFEAKLVDIDAGAQRDPAYLKLNPAGRVPTLVVDGVPYGESTALLMLLAERHPEAGLAPIPGSPDRAAWLETMVFLANTIMPAMRDWFYAASDGPKESPQIIQNLARHRIEAAWERLDKKCADGRAFLIGDKLSTADLMAIMLMRWSRNMPKPATSWPHLHRYVQELRKLPSFVTLNAREGLTDWLN